MLPASSTPLQYRFYPLCTTLPTFGHPTDIRKTLALFPTNLIFRRTSASEWHTERGPAPVKHPPEYVVNITPGNGLQVKFCPWKVGPRLSVCPWDPEIASPPAGALWLLLQEILPPTRVYLWSGLAHGRPSFAPGGLLLDICSEEQNSQRFYHCYLKM